MPLRIARAMLVMAAPLLFATAAWASTPVGDHGALKVTGNRIVDSHDKPVKLNGVSFFWSNTGWGQEKFYNSAAVATFARDWNVSVVRAAIGIDGSGGYKEDPVAGRTRAEAIVDAAIANDVYVIIDWHSHHAETDPQLAVDFFTAMARKYGHTPNVIYEIYNEPLREADWKTTVKPYSQTVINAIRAIDPDNLIVVGSPTWSQDVDIAAADPVTGGNITYTLHFYAGSHKQDLRDKGDAALKMGASLFVSEWGTVNANGDGDADAAETTRWQTWMQANCLSQANWSVSDKKEGASLFKPGASATGPWTDTDLTPSGLLVRDILKNASTSCNGD
ncbi:glycoside hydrolase family 5 protein [Asticcacaulis sp. AC402]|uniref:glycoside hydrolase family 5 protein n=1 Tax=Asticcacaulis sp. AC402 TaxID=1282361 RepID=UPI0003C4042D|nr:glycoside hydrolase family 5 protein [Asticcacaulis sp. AC402]ESQ74362.1 endoglucanase [Asticcacaulis sp. AC402]